MGRPLQKPGLRRRSPMALFDPVSIAREIEATPFAHARNVVVAYPHREDWKKLYRPQPLRMPDARGIYRNVDAFESRYQDMKRDHENNVLKCLGMFQRWAAGRAVHAARLISGAHRTFPLGGGYHNNEEFLANTIEMIYRSDKGLPIYDYGYHSFDPASFLERNMATVLLTDLLFAQQSLFDALAKVNAGFNPIKQIDDRRRKLLGG